MGISTENGRSGSLFWAVQFSGNRPDFRNCREYPHFTHQLRNAKLLLLSFALHML